MTLKRIDGVLNKAFIEGIDCGKLRILISFSRSHNPISEIGDLQCKFLEFIATVTTAGKRKGRDLFGLLG